jgi:hypothetical protein
VSGKSGLIHLGGWSINPAEALYHSDHPVAYPTKPGAPGSGCSEHTDPITDEFAISIPLKVRRSTIGDKLVTADVLPSNSC